MNEHVFGQLRGVVTKIVDEGHEYEVTTKKGRICRVVYYGEEVHEKPLVLGEKIFLEEPMIWFDDGEIVYHLPDNPAWLYRGEEAEEDYGYKQMMKSP